MREIWKYAIPPTDEGKLFEWLVPKGARLLTVGVVGIQPVVWALVDPNGEAVSREIRVVETGELFDERLAEYIGTFVAEHHWRTHHELTSPYVGHVFEELVRE